MVSIVASRRLDRLSGFLSGDVGFIMNRFEDITILLGELGIYMYRDEARLVLFRQQCFGALAAFLSPRLKSCRFGRSPTSLS
jgi:hypothetical protein